MIPYENQENGAMPLDMRTQQALRAMGLSVQQLNAEANRAHTYITDLEKALEEARPGVECWVVAYQSDPGACVDLRGNDYSIVRTVEIGFGKHGAKWALLAADRTYYTDDSLEVDWEKPRTEDETVVLLRDSDRVTKIRAVPVLPRLIEDMTQKIEQMTRAAAEVLDKNA